MKLDRALEIVKKVQRDVEKDIKEVENKPFSAEVVSKLFGYQGAAIVAVAAILENLIIEIKENNNDQL